MIWVLVTIDGDLKKEIVEIDVDFHTFTRYISKTWLRSWHIWMEKKYWFLLVKGSCSLWLQCTCRTSTNPSIFSKDLNCRWWSIFFHFKLSRLTKVDMCIASVLTTYQQHAFIPCCLISQCMWHQKTSNNNLFIFACEGNSRVDLLTSWVVCTTM
jgi:hypothetical protein